MNPERLRILFVLPQIPYPLDRGGKIVTYHLVKGMLQRHEVWVAALIHHPEEQEQAEEFRAMCPRLHTFPAASRWSPGKLARAALSRRPYKVHRFFNRDMAAWVQQCVAQQAMDVLHCQNFYTAQYVTGGEPCGRVLYQENFESLLVERFVKESQQNLLLRLAMLMQYSRTLRYEIEVCGRFDRVLMISEADRRRLAQYAPEAPLEVLSPGVDLEYYRPCGRPPKPGRVVFTGSMNYLPNVDAVKFFCSQVWPRVRRAIPGAEFFIVGQRPEAPVLRLHGHEGVTVTGRVEDVRPYLDEAAVYVVPLRIAGGVRLKILEAMAAGKAVVSSTIGAEGLPVTPGENIILADGADEMARAIIMLLGEPGRREALESGARRFAQERGDWEQVTNRLERIYLEVARRGARCQNPRC